MTRPTLPPAGIALTTVFALALAFAAVRAPGASAPMESGSPLSSPARSADRKDGRSEILAPRAPIDPALQRKLTALAAAKRTGSAARVRSLHAELGWGVPATRAFSGNSAIPPGWQRVVRPLLRDRPPRWQYDVLVTGPASPSGRPAMCCQYQGLMYVAVEDLDRNYIDLYLSDNDGATWHYTYSITGGEDDVTNPTLAFGEGEANRMLIAYEYARGTPSAAIHVYWEDADTGDYGLWVVASGLLVSRPRICVDSPDVFNWYPYLTFVRGTITDGFERPERYDVRFSRSLDLGGSWENPTTLATGVAEEDSPDIDFGDLNLYATYTRTYAPGDRDTYVRRSTTWGSSWDDEVTLGYSTDDEYDPCVAATNGGNAVVVAYTRRTQPTTSYIDLFYSTNAGDSWNYSFLPASPAYDAGGVDLAVNCGHGKIHAAFLDDQDVYYSSADYSSPNSWSPFELVNDEHGAVPGERPAIAINPDRPIEECIVWMDQRYPSQRRIYFDAAYPIGQYVIVLADASLLYDIEPLIQWKRSLGYGVVVKTVPEILAQFSGRDDAESIWLYLNRDWEATRYVLLVGEVDTIPMRLLYLDGNPGDGKGFGSDYYYALLNTNSWDEDGDRRWGEPSHDAVWLVPDVMVGRVPLSSPNALGAFVQGVVDAEQAQGAWKRNVLLAHGFYNHREETQPRADEAVVAERIVGDWLTPNAWTSVQLYEKAGLDTSYYACDDALSEANFIRERAPGRVGVISACAHGHETGMLGYIWREDINHNGIADPKDPHREYDSNPFSRFVNIGNAATSAVVFHVGCETGVVFEPDPTFAFSGLRSLQLFRQPSGNMSLRAYLTGGAPAAIGSSAGSDYIALWVDPAEGGTESLDYYFFEYLAQRGLRTGDAFQMALVRHVSEHTPIRGVRDFNFFGDPSYEVTGAGGRRWNSTGLPVQRLLEGVPGLTAAGSGVADGLQAASFASGSTVAEQRDDETTWWQPGEIADAMQVGTIIAAADGTLYAGVDLPDDVLEHVGVVLRSFDQGESWIPMGELPFCWSVSTLFETASGSLMACGLARADEQWYGIIYRSSDGGVQWDIVAALEDAMVFDVAQAPGGTLWACAGWDGWILRSSDDGVSWEATALLGTGIYPYSILPASTGRLFVAMGGPGAPISLAYSDDGITWLPPIIGADLTGAYDLMEQGGLLFAGARSDAGGAICASDLNGEAWILAYTLPDPRVQSVRSLCSGPAGYIFAGGDMQRGPSETYVYARDPQSGLWDVFGGALDMANYVRTLCVTPNALYAGTGELYGRVYRHLLPTGSAVDDHEPCCSAPFAIRVCPNPSIGRTEIRCALAAPAPLVIRIHDAAGRLVRTLENEAHVPAGPRITVWDGRDTAGRRLPAGVYTYQALAGHNSGSGRLILLR